MKVGFVVECFRDGADHKVLQHLVAHLNPRIKTSFACAGSKRVIFEDCGRLVEGLFEAEGCERVFVVWDLVPSDHHDQGKPSCVHERAHILAKLREIDRSRTILLCVTNELEAWLLADGSAIKTVVERPSHPIGRIADIKKPEQDPNPKKTLNRIFHEHRGQRFDYMDAVHAIKIIEKASLRKLRVAPSFARFEAKITSL